MKWLIALIFSSWTANAASYIESSLNPDISGDPNNPLILTLTPGFNTIAGVIGTSTGAGQPLIGTGAILQPGNDAEYFVINIPTGSQLSSIKLDNYTFDLDSNPGGSFIGYAFGNRFPLNPMSATDIAASDLFTRSDISNEREILSLNTNPLQAGSYAFLIQETSPNSTVNYVLSFELTESAVIPEPSVIFCSASVLLLLLRRRRSQICCEK